MRQKEFPFVKFVSMILTFDMELKILNLYCTCHISEYCYKRLGLYEIDRWKP